MASHNVLYVYIYIYKQRRVVSACRYFMLLACLNTATSGSHPYETQYFVKDTNHSKFGSILG